jgi:DNA-binding response OmpR family regulator
MIEDDMSFVRLVEKITRADGHIIVHASSALRGLDVAEDQAIDLVLLDMDLPDLDGKVVATMLRARAALAKVPIIAVTAYTDNVARRLALAFGCNGFIPKPIDTRTFPAQIATYLNPK